ncbi:MAG: Uma2 family endonuclease [Leptolyngbyaceae cyanobacterium bins.349]|nr:Uma2 family endonuclease [Leptolyngbyaceae cyanobacterium bins.349]
MTITTAPSTSDQRILLSSRTWEQFQLIQQGFADSPGVRLGFYDGEIEILMPGREHEVFKGIIALLMGIFFEVNNIEFEPTGSMTQEKPGLVSAEADESYCIGTSKPTPDLVIEVVFTSGGAMKLRRYQALGVPEVWFWQDGVFTLYRLRESGYEQISQSEIAELATLNLELLTRCVLTGETSRLEAIRQFRAGLQTR